MGRGFNSSGGGRGGLSVCVCVCAGSRLPARKSPNHPPRHDKQMANHSFESNAEIRANENGEVAMIANKQVGFEGWNTAVAVRPSLCRGLVVVHCTTVQYSMISRPTHPNPA